MMMMLSRILSLSVFFKCLMNVISQDPVDLSYSILEELPTGSLIANIAEDANLHQKYNNVIFQKLRYTFLNTDNPDNAFISLSEYGGIISTAQKIDRDTLEQCQGVDKCYVHVQVAVSPPEYFQIIRISVEIKDMNDNQPQFPSNFVVMEIPESVSINATYLTPAAIDPDVGNYAIQSYEIFPPSDTFGFKLVDNIDGSKDVGIVVKKKLDREVQDFYQVKLIAKDGGTPPFTGWTTINIQVKDVNDNSPIFDNSTYSVRVEENIPINSTVIQVRATDSDSGLNGDLFYYINPRSPAAVKSLFFLDNKTGEISTLQGLDYEEGREYNIPILVRDHGKPPKMDAAIVKVVVLDLNDNRPEIVINTLSSAQQIYVSENSGNGTIVVPVTIFDRDSGENGRFACRLSNSKFALRHMYDNQYKIVLEKQLDYEKKRRHNLTMWCQDGGNPKLTSMKQISVAVKDENDHAPVFPESLYFLSIVENNEIGDPVGDVKAIDLDRGVNGQVLHKLSLDSDADYFHVDQYSGLITAKSVFDREVKDEYMFYVVAVDGSQDAKMNTAMVVVSVLDQNDEAPVFSRNNYPFVIPENQSKVTIVGQVNATDDDIGFNSEVWYKIDPRATAELKLFSITPKSGEIYTTEVLDREVKAIHSFAVIATDRGSPMKSSSAVVTVELTDINDEIPRIEFPIPENDTISVSYQTPVGIAVTQILAFDDDIGENGRLTYFIHSGNSDEIFAVDPSTGEVLIKNVIPPENLNTYAVTIGVHDNGKPKHMAYVTASFVITKEPYVAKSDAAMNGPHQNLIIVVCLSSISAVLVVVLIVAIIWMKRRNRDSEVRYNCRIEANKVLMNKKTEPTISTNGKQAQRNPNPEGSETDEGGSTISTISKGEIQVERRTNGQVVTTFPAQNATEAYKLSYIQSKAAPGLTVLPPGDRTFSAAQGHKPTDAQVNSLISMLKRDHRDSDSACSVEISNPDSGRGSSEVDIHSRCSRQSPNQAMYYDLHRHSRRSNSASILDQPQSKPLQQIRYTPPYAKNLPYYPSAQYSHNDISHQAPVHKSYSGNFIPGIVPRSRQYSDQVRGQQRHSDYYNTAPPPIANGAKLNAATYQNGGGMYNGYSRHSLKYNRPNRNRRRDPTGTLVHDESIDEISGDSDVDNYSCGDIDKEQNIGEESSDGGSTTSGEYMVDADGMVQEVDHLFFQDMVV